jgi:hypothetical protein
LTNETFLNPCLNDDTADKTFKEYKKSLYLELEAFLLQQCLIPCDQTVFEAKLSSFHINNFVTGYKNVINASKSIVYFSFRCETFNREKHIETLTYNTENFLTQTGGNLGLFLGLSCFSMILSIIKCFKNCQRLQRNSFEII